MCLYSFMLFLSIRWQVRSLMMSAQNWHSRKTCLARKPPSSSLSQVSIFSFVQSEARSCHWPRYMFVIMLNPLYVSVNVTMSSLGLPIQEKMKNYMSTRHTINPVARRRAKLWYDMIGYLYSAYYIHNSIRTSDGRKEKHNTNMVLWWTPWLQQFYCAMKTNNKQQTFTNIDWLIETCRRATKKETERKRMSRYIIQLFFSLISINTFVQLKEFHDYSFLLHVYYD